MSVSCITNSGLFLLGIIEEIANRNASKYSFAYYEPDDIKQEVTLKCLQIVTSFSGTTPNEARAYFNTCATNYLKNLKRDNYVHIVPPCMPGGYASHDRPSGIHHCIYWNPDSAKSTPCRLSLYDTCAAWQSYKQYVQRRLNAANPITAEEDIIDAKQSSAIDEFDLQDSILAKLPAKLHDAYFQLLNGERINAKTRLKIQQITSGILYG